MSGTRLLHLAAHFESLKPIREFILESAHSAGLGQERSGELLLAVDEAATNIVMHGCPQGGCTIELEFRSNPDACVVHIRDDAPLFDPTALDDPDLAVSPLDREQMGGFGVYLFKHLVDQTSYRTTPDGRNELTLLKRIG
jgi:serine/threonine-protein kinase RsbW